jgi:hypothetical protein
MAWNKYNIDNECSPKEIVEIIADEFFKKRRQKNTIIMRIDIKFSAYDTVLE